MNFAAFFRNTNLGRPPAPTKAQLEHAFLAAGATKAASFLTNGTVAFDVAPRRSASRILAKARANLRETCGLEEPAFLRELTYLSALIGENPFQSVDRAAVYDCYVTFLHDDFVLPASPPRANAKKNVEVIEFTEAEMLCVAHKFKQSPGSPNAFAERQFGLPATTRAWNTVVRLVAKHA